MTATHTASEARAKFYGLMDETAASHQPILITGKRTNSILLSEEDWHAIQETLHLLAVPGMRESIKAGMGEPLEAAAQAQELDW
jgi:antitoxin YefM